MMSTELLERALVGLLPALVLLVILLFLDSYKLVRLKVTLAVIFAGALATVAAWFVNGALHGYWLMDATAFSRYAAPVIEECLKAIVMVSLFRTHRIGFLVDSAIMGFAVGAGFALAENLLHLFTGAIEPMGVWIVRGFGTAVMHGGVAAIFGIVSQALTERNMRINPLFYLPGLAAAISLHSLFNHFPVHPVYQTMAILVLLPPLVLLVFRRSARHLHQWLQVDFDEDAALLQQILAGGFTDTRIGRFLRDLKQKFDGPVVVDMLCYLRLYTELALRAKGVLMMRENGLEAPVGQRTRAKFDELAFLEKSIGPTGILALRPFLHLSRKDLWQLYVLGDAAALKRDRQ